VFLRKIALLNFKNHPQRQLAFTKKLNCFIGNNGVGKTNLIDAIYYLCLTKSYFNSTDQQNILFGQDFFRLEGDFEKQSQPYQLVYKLSGTRRKELTINDAPVPKLSDHVGNFPAIIITPDDSQLILGNSDERRKFLDSTISQVNHDYLLWVIQYHKILAQRNAALKRLSDSVYLDKELIQTYNRQLVPLGNNIFKARQIAIEKLLPLFNAFYKNLSLEREQVGMAYVSQLSNKPFDELLEANFDKDVMLQRTDAGIHKDDIDFFLSRGPKVSPIATDLRATSVEQAAAKMKRFGSQGQQKSFIISIKFAQYDFIRKAKDFKPLLLIDDIFDKLDNDRSQKLVEMIAGSNFGQVFLTDTDDAHIRQTLHGKDELFEVFNV
jgi:DNA replication and repair protein RecF